MRWYYPVGVALAAALIILAVMLRRRAVKLKNREQMTKKAQEDALNRAISNSLHRDSGENAAAPLEVHYNTDTHGAKGSRMLSIVALEESLTKEYIFGRGDDLFLGDEHGRAAIFRTPDGHKIFCEIFNRGGDVYACQRGVGRGRLTRGRRHAPLSSEGIRLRSGDIIEGTYGRFRIDLLG